jgi:hypothetical protein
MATPAQRPASPPASVSTGLSGIWTGTYYYSSGNKQQPVQFIFNFSQTGCSGRSEEPNTFGEKSAPKLFANLSCSVTSLSAGQVITIVKTYDGTGGVSHSVLYTGTVSPDMRTIYGRWAIKSVRGDFIMSR